MIPEGYTAHDGGERPVDENEFVDCIIRTSEGLGHSGVMRAKMHEWDSSKHPDGIGAVVAYRIGYKGERLPEELQTLRWEEVSAA